MTLSLLSADRTLPALDRVAVVSVLLTPLLLLHAHGFAEASMAVASLCFLGHAALTRQWGWLATPWTRMGLIWSGWLVICSMPIPALGLGEGGWPSLGQAAMTVRFPLFLATMEHYALRDPRARLWLRNIVAAGALYIAANCLFQFVVGRNLYGHSLQGSDTLTGPFGKSRAGPPLARMLMPALATPLVTLLGRRERWSSPLAYALMLSAIAIMVLIGQRMPLVLALAGMAIVGLLLRPLRPVVLAGGLAGMLLLAASPVVAPTAYNRLVVQFAALLEKFPSSHYGELYTRALEIGIQHPVTGRGFDSFRYGCEQPRYFRASLDGKDADGGGAAICAAHPHNFYVQALADGGFVGLALFCALALTWLMPLARGLWRGATPVRVGLFASIVVQLFPFQSTSGFYTLPLGGWFFLLLGWGLAEFRHRAPEA